MGTYTGSYRADVITPDNISAGVSSNPPGSRPSADVDSIEGQQGNDILDGGGGADTINGGDGSDTVEDGYGLRGVLNSGNIVRGDTGDDAISIYALGTGAANSVSNVAYGDDGNDLVQVQIGDIYTWDGSEVFGEAPTGDISLHGGADNDSLEVFSYERASGYTTSMHGDGGADTLRATTYFAEFDQLDGGNNVDRLYGGSGNDEYHVREGQDAVIEDTGQGNDVVYAYDIDYTLPANVEELIMTVSYYPWRSPERPYYARGNELDNTIRIDQLSGEEYEVDGMGGNDVLFGSIGTLDTLSGGAGNDTIYGKPLTPDYSYLDDADTVRGGSGNDLIYGGGGDADTWDGNDKLYGDDGDDRIFGSFGDDLMYGGTGNDELGGQAGNDTLYGDAGIDKLGGGSGNDLLYGGTENDMLSGRDGLDKLYGQGGNDVFDYDAVTESKPGATLRDLIYDFAGIGGSTRTEAIDLSTIDANTGASGNQAFAFKGTAGFTAPAQVRVQAISGTTDTLIQANVTGTSGAELEIQVKDGAVLPTAWNGLDFFL